MVERIRTLLDSRQLTPTQFADVIGIARPIVSHILSGRNKPSLEVVQRILAAMPDLAMPWLLNGTGPMLALSVSSATAGPPPVAVPIALAPTPKPVSSAVDEPRLTGVEADIVVPQIPEFRIERPEQESVRSAMPTDVPARPGPPAPGRNRIAPKRFVANAVPLDALPQPLAITPAPAQPLAFDTEWPPIVAPVQDAGLGLSVSLPLPADVPAAAIPLPPAPAADEMSGAALASALFAGGDKPIRRIVIFYRDGSFADYQPE